MSLSSVKDSVRWLSYPSGMRQPLVRLISANQDDLPAVQVMAPAVALALYGRALDIDPHELVAKAQRMINDIDAPFSHQWRAMEEYAKNELRGARW